MNSHEERRGGLSKHQSRQPAPTEKTEKKPAADCSAAGLFSGPLLPSAAVNAVEKKHIEIGIF